MKIFKFKKIDAFTDGMSGGNPAAVIYLDSFKQISENEMQKIAQEMGGFVNEVGYVSQEGESTFRLRYFSSEREVEFCGHATIAIMYDLIKQNSELLKKSSLTIITNQDELNVENKIAAEDAVFISAPLPKSTSCEIPLKHIEQALKIDKGVIDQDLQIDIINAGLQTLIIPTVSLEGILSISPNEHELKTFCVNNNLDIIIVFSPEVVSPQNSYRTRVFAPTFGYLEDPATGSGNAALGYSLLKQKLWDGGVMSIEQNGLQHGYNTVKILAQHGTAQETQVVFGGRAITKITGTYQIN